jgi:hypothetical protein
MELTLQEADQQLPKRSKLQKMRAWMRGRYAIRNSRDTFVSRIAAGSTALFGSLSMLAAVLGMPTGFGTLIDIIVFLTANAAVMGITTILLSSILSFMYVPLPRRFIAVGLYVGIETYLILYFAELGILMSVVFSFIFTVMGALSGCLLGLLLSLRVKARSKALMALMFACLTGSLSVTVDWAKPAPVPHREAVQDDHAHVHVDAIQAPNPAEQGGFKVQTFTYGSGKDKHRAIFGNEVDVQTAAVDASGYITKWPGFKTRFWGFDEHALPLNGRVWMPSGEGAFPLVLIVHGNHLMENFSDGGYGYLGELLASKGIIAVSVDENFLNYSVWSGIPNHDMKMRAWILLKHLQQIQLLNEQTGNPFSGRVDMSNIALIGHSRGGQAVAMAADADRWFKNDKSLEGMEDAQIQSVVAIAPTDKRVDDKSARLIDVNYLTLQGARDADVNNFYGDRQYGRTSFGRQTGKFKAALYIADANHSQFNTAWGRMDEHPPGGLFLNREGLLETGEQQQISKVYVSAFLQITLLGHSEYSPLFRDYRKGIKWLPNTEFISRYEESGFAEIARYEDDAGKTALKGGGKARAVGMSKWQITYAEDRDGKNKGTKGVELEWSRPGAQYELDLPSEMSDRTQGMTKASLVFSMANLERDLSVGEDKAFDRANRMLKLPPLPEVEIELLTKQGEIKRIALAEVMPVPPSAYSAFMSFSWLEKRMKKEKYKESSEPVFQTYVLPIDQFGQEETPIEPDEISRITFRFVNGPGKVMLDDIGIMKE